MHPESSSSKNTLSDLLHFYKPGKNEKISFRSWRHLYEKMKMVNNIPLDFVEKTSVIGYILRDCISSRREYISEIKNAVMYVFGVSPSSVSVQRNTHNPYLRSVDKKSDDHV